MVAREVGYDFEAAFNRAFKRAYGAPPELWRQYYSRPRRRLTDP